MNGSRFSIRYIFYREYHFEVLITYELVMDVENTLQKITPTSKT